MFLPSIQPSSRRLRRNASFWHDSVVGFPLPRKPIRRMFVGCAWIAKVAVPNVAATARMNVRRSNIELPREFCDSAMRTRAEPRKALFEIRDQIIRIFESDV